MSSQIFVDRFDKRPKLLGKIQVDLAGGLAEGVQGLEGKISDSRSGCRDVGFNNLSAVLIVELLLPERGFVPELKAFQLKLIAAGNPGGEDRGDKRKSQCGDGDDERPVHRGGGLNRCGLRNGENGRRDAGDGLGDNPAIPNSISF